MGSRLVLLYHDTCFGEKRFIDVFFGVEVRLGSEHVYNYLVVF